MSSRFATESSVTLGERVENFLLPHDKLNLEKFSIPLSLSFPSSSRSPLLAYSSSFSLLRVFIVFPHKDALPPVFGGE